MWSARDGQPPSGMAQSTKDVNDTLVNNDLSQGALTSLSRESMNCRSCQDRIADASGNVSHNESDERRRVSKAVNTVEGTKSAIS
jgi:hypothetical protein